MLSKYEKNFVDHNAEHFYNEYAKNRFSQLNQPIDSFVERQQLNDCLPIFPDIPGTSRKDTRFNSSNKYANSHLTPIYLASSPDSGIPQSSLHTPLSFQPESIVKTSQPTTPCRLPQSSIINPNNFQSTSTGTTPRSRNAGTLRNSPPEWYGEPYFYIFSNLSLPFYLFPY